MENGKNLLPGAHYDLWGNHGARARARSHAAVTMFTCSLAVTSNQPDHTDWPSQIKVLFQMDL